MNKNNRIPLTTSVTPETRAFLEDEAFRRSCSVADVLNEILEADFKGTKKSEFYHAYLDKLKKKKK